MQRVAPSPHRHRGQRGDDCHAYREVSGGRGDRGDGVRGGRRGWASKALDLPRRAEEVAQVVEEVHRAAVQEGRRQEPVPLRGPPERRPEDQRRRQRKVPREQARRRERGATHSHRDARELEGDGQGKRWWPAQSGRDLASHLATRETPPALHAATSTVDAVNGS